MRKASSTLNARTLSLLLAILLLAWLGVRSLESVAAAHDSQNSDVVPDAVDINVDITIDDRGEPVGHVVNVASGDVGVIAKAVADEYPRQLATGTEAGKIQVVIRPTRRVKYQYVIKLYQAVLDTGLTRVALAHTEK